MIVHRHLSYLQTTLLYCYLSIALEIENRIAESLETSFYPLLYVCDKDTELAMFYW